MNISILNGNPEIGSGSFDGYLERVKEQLEIKQHSVTILQLRDMDLKYCTGCFGCWVKNPGECVNHDDGSVLRQSIIACDLMIWASPLKLGFVSNLLKRAMDKSIPLLLPYIDPINDEAHHAKRYEHYPLTGLIYEQEADTDDLDRQLLENIFARASLNFRSRLTFCRDITTSAPELADLITGAAQIHNPQPEAPRPTTGNRITPPGHLTVFNGSPRGRKGNTPILLEQFLSGFKEGKGGTYEMHDLIQIKQMEHFAEAFGKAKCVLLAFPLYTDAMPGSVMAFIEKLEQFKGRPDNPPLAFLVQSGFPETDHSRHVEQYLKKLSERLGCPYVGTIVKGGVEGIQIQPENMTRNLFDKMKEIGKVFGTTGEFNPELLAQLTGIGQLPGAARFLMKLLSKTRIPGIYWDMQLKKNNAFDRRYDRPYSQ